MFKNVKAEMARKGFSLNKTVEELEKVGEFMTVGTLFNKLKGKTKFTFNEAVALKKVLGTDMPLEELFEEAV